MLEFFGGFALGRASKSCGASGGGDMGGVVFLFIIMLISLLIMTISDYVYAYYMYINSFVFDDIVRLTSQSQSSNSLVTIADDMFPKFEKYFFALMCLATGVMFFVFFYLLGKKSEEKSVRIATIILGLVHSFLFTPVLINFSLIILVGA